MRRLCSVIGKCGLYLICLAAIGCNRTSDGNGADSTESADMDAMEFREAVPYDTLTDTIAQHYEEVMRDFAHLEEVRREQDQVLNTRLNEESRLNREAEPDRSTGHLQKQTETQLLYELQELDASALPKMQKINNALRFNTEPRSEMLKLITEVKSIRRRQLDIAYELGDQKLIREYRNEVENLTNLEFDYVN